MRYAEPSNTPTHLRVEAAYGVNRAGAAAAAADAAAADAAGSPPRHRLQPKSFGVVSEGTDGKHPLGRDAMPQTPAPHR